jgi:uncharacterized membrane protein YdjX (TVP38/TMEM64 family)
MKGKFLKLAVLAVVVAAAAILVFRGGSLLGLVHRGIDEIRGLGPWAFYAAMATLPAAGVPMLAFSLTAASAFGPTMGMGGVVAAGLAAVAVNLAFTYWLARRALRPWLARILEKLGYRLPAVSRADMTDLIVLIRVTPGVPFFAQNYLLGLADAPVGPYLAISCAITFAQTTAFILFGDALIHGRGRAGLLALSLLLALTAATHLLRRHYGRKAKPAA